MAIYKVWQSRPREAWFALSQEDRQSLLARTAEALTTVGAKALLTCSASWSNEEWPYFGLEEFPSIDAVQRHSQILLDMDLDRYRESRMTLGTQMPTP